MNKHVSPALCRFFGSVVFFSVGLGCFQLGNRVFGLGIDIGNFEWGSMTAGGWALLVLSVLAAMVASLAIGFGTGFSIEVRSEAVDFAISTIWHYLANGSLLWIGMWGMCLTKLFGKGGAREFVKQLKQTQAGLEVFGLGIAVCILMGVLLLLTGQFRFGAKPGMAGCFAVSAPVALAGCYLEARVLGIETWLWIPIAIILSAILVPFNAYMVQRDKIQRYQIMERR